MKKQKAKKTGAKKEEKAEPAAEALKDEDTAEAEALLDANGENAAAEEGSKAKDAEETALEANTSKSHDRQPSLSLQSKLRSSSFRQSGPLSPGVMFSPDGDTAPDIYRKQSLRIEELEKESKRLAKEASDGEKRWKKAEEELEDLREAEGDSASKGKDATGSSGESEKLVFRSFTCCIIF